jgi:hypothetical protein
MLKIKTAGSVVLTNVHLDLFNFELSLQIKLNIVVPLS